ncbi:MAG: glycosyltransferase family 2 protein [Rubrivivax sp.]|nr:MAG: glycosyltransferase family 2 protein [Rubrivivax sp.]
MAMDVTVLVPAYKSQYLGELLQALQSQTVPPARVVLSDDSPDQAFLKALDTAKARAAYPALNIEVIQGPRAGAWANFRHLLQHYQGETEFFHLQLDDDIPYPQFYERHSQAHGLARTQCAVSRRWTAIESGQPISSLPVPDAVSNHPQRMFALGPEVLFQHTVAGTNNWLGEFSNATFRAAMREELLTTRLAGISFTGLEDIGAFLVASQQAPVAFINEHLGYFRTSPGQNTSQTTGRIFKLGLLAWPALALASHRLGHLTAQQLAAVAQRMGTAVLQHYRAVDAAMCGVAELALALGSGSAAEADYLAAWHAYCGAEEAA